MTCHTARKHCHVNASSSTHCELLGGEELPGQKAGRVLLLYLPVGAGVENSLVCMVGAVSE